MEANMAEESLQNRAAHSTVLDSNSAGKRSAFENRCWVESGPPRLQAYELLDSNAWFQ